MWQGRRGRNCRPCSKKRCPFGAVLCPVKERGIIQPPAGFFVGYRFPFPHLCALHCSVGSVSSLPLIDHRSWGQVYEYVHALLCSALMGWRYVARTRPGTPAPSSVARGAPAPSRSAPLLKVAPLVVARGKGERCPALRAGLFLSATAQNGEYQNNSSKLEPFFLLRNRIPILPYYFNIRLTAPPKTQSWAPPTPLGGSAPSN